MHSRLARGPMIAWIMGGASAVAAVTAAAAVAVVFRRGRSKRREREAPETSATVIVQSDAPHRLRGLVITWLLAWATAGAIGGAGALAVVELGLYDTTASMPHYAIMGWATHRTFIDSVKRRAGAVASPTFTPGEVTAGFRLYDHDCVICHGGPGVPRAHFVAGMTPTPPYVIDAARRWTPAQLYWILAQGVKMTAMPSWRASRTNVQVWDDVAFLEALPYLSPKQYAIMRAAETGTEQTQADAQKQHFTSTTLSAGRPLSKPECN